MTTRQKQGRNRLLLSWLVAVVIALAAAGGWYWHSNKMPTVPVQIVAEKTSAKFDLPAGKWQMAMNPEALKELGLGGNTNVLTNGLDFSKLQGITDPKELEIQLNWLIDDYIKSIKPSAATLLGYAKELGIPEAEGVELQELLEKFNLNGEEITISSDKAVAIAEALRVKLLTDSKKLGTVETGHNTGIDKAGNVVYDKNTNITGDNQCISFTGKNGDDYHLLRRCGNIVFEKPPENIPPGIIERIPEVIPPGKTPKEYLIQGIKVWYDDNNRHNTRPGSITIRLYRYDPTKSPKIVLLETATVKGGKSSLEWSFQFQGRYPELKVRGAHYYVSEDYVRNYKSSNNNVVTFNGGVGQVSITNSLIPGDGGLQPKSNNLRDYGAIQGAQPAQTTQLTTPPVDNKPQKGESSILDKVTAPAPNLTAPGAVDENSKKEQGQPAHTETQKSPDGDVNKDVTDNVGDTTAPVTAPNDVPDPVNTTTPDSTGDNSSVGSNPNDGAPVDFNGGD